MQLATAQRPQASNSSASSTLTLTGAPPSLQNIPSGTLILRGAPSTNRRVTWDEGVVDNEGLGRKSSKVCCIFRKQRAFGESSSESSSDSSDDDSDWSEKDGDGTGHGDEGERHRHGKACMHGKRKRVRSVSPNAYEKMPNYSKNKKKERQKRKEDVKPDAGKDARSSPEASEPTEQKPPSQHGDGA